VLIPFVVALVGKRLPPYCLLRYRSSFCSPCLSSSSLAMPLAIERTATDRGLRILLVYVQYLAAMDEQHSVGNGQCCTRFLASSNCQRPQSPMFCLFSLIGIAIFDTRYPPAVVEALPAAGISSTRSCWWLFLCRSPCGFTDCYRCPFSTVLSLVITWVGDTAAYFVAGPWAATRSRHT